MNNKEFEEIFDSTVSTARALLVEKAKEYASNVDRMHNFKAAAGALNVTPELALRGMSTKHTISVNDMVKNPDNYTMAQWEEKLGDELNYIILLKALVWERLNDNADREAKAEEDAKDFTLEELTLGGARLGFRSVDALGAYYKRFQTMVLEGKIRVDKEMELEMNQIDHFLYSQTEVETKEQGDEEDGITKGLRHGFSREQMSTARTMGFTSLGYFKDDGKPVLFSRIGSHLGKLSILTADDFDVVGSVSNSSIAYHGEEI